MGSPARPQLVLLDDHEVVREGIAGRLTAPPLEAVFVYSGDSLRDAVAAARESRCDCAIVDLDLGDGSPVAQIVADFVSIEVPVVVVSAMARRGAVQAAMHAGARGFVTKRARLDSLVEAVTAILAGESWVPSDLAEEMLGATDGVALSEQERRALVLYASGLTLESVARRMGIAPHTVKHYIDRVRDKYTAAGIPARTKVQLHEVARQSGFIP